LRKSGIAFGSPKRNETDYMDDGDPYCYLVELFLVVSGTIIQPNYNQ
jgi:hypothetical protein